MLSASSAIKPSYLDFRVLSKLFQYQSVDRDISRVVLQKLQNHLSPEAVALAFFNSSLLFESKQKMVDVLNCESSNKNINRVEIQVDNIPKITQKGIEQFVSTKTKTFFKRFELNDKFFQADTSTWHTNTSFLERLGRK